MLCKYTTSLSFTTFSGGEASRGPGGFFLYSSAASLRGSWHLHWLTLLMVLNLAWTSWYMEILVFFFRLSYISQLPNRIPNHQDSGFLAIPLIPVFQASPEQDSKRLALAFLSGPKKFWFQGEFWRNLLDSENGKHSGICFFSPPKKSRTKNWGNSSPQWCWFLLWTYVSTTKPRFKMMFLFTRGDMLIPQGEGS